jgi:hypothetical protein
MAQFVEVARTADLAADEAKRVEVTGKKIALFNLEGTFYVIDDTRTHRGGPLFEGEVSGEKATRPAGRRGLIARGGPTIFCHGSHPQRHGRVRAEQPRAA